MPGRITRARVTRSQELARIFDNTVRLYLRLSALSTKLHGGGALSGPRRTVLVGLARGGPQTVAQMARARAQSRQRFQPLVNALRRDGLVTLIANPAHKQSALVALTPRGRREVTRIHQVESQGRPSVGLRLPAHSLSSCADVLQELVIEIERVLAEPPPKVASRTKLR
jgi:DNA-binding MarR family transcriptional regulator